jgi:hypothetical protein
LPQLEATLAVAKQAYATAMQRLHIISLEVHDAREARRAAARAALAAQAQALSPEGAQMMAQVSVPKSASGA